MERAAVVFLPGILMPASVRYAPVLAELDEVGDTRAVLTKELEVYSSAEPPPGYSIDLEVEGLDRFADEQGLERFHLYGHSAGGSIALAYLSARPERLLSVALDEPASDFSDDDRRALVADLPSDLDDLPVPERMTVFARSLVRPGVELPMSGPPSDNPELAKRPAGVASFGRALASYQMDFDLGSFTQPVYYSYGSLSNERWEAMARRFQEEFMRCTVELYDGVHHLNTSHQADPARTAAALQRLWSEAEVNRRNEP